MRLIRNIDFLGPGVIVVALLFWEGLGMLGVLPSGLPRASAVFVAAGEMTVSTSFWAGVADTMTSTLIGLLLAILVAVPLGVLLGRNDLILRALQPTIEFLRPINPVVLVPLALLIFVGLELKLFLVIYGCIWPILVATIYAVRSVDGTVIDTARVYNLNTRQVFFRIVLPQAGPEISTGIRVGATIALLVSVLSELIAGANGLGRSLLQAQSDGTFPMLYALVVAIGILGVLMNIAFVRTERRIFFWSAENRVKNG